VAAAQARAAGEAAAEVVRLKDSVQLAVSALSAIGDSARRLSRYSARVRVLELEVLPAGPYLGVCVQALHDELAAWQTPRRWPQRMTARVEEIQVMLERAIEITATVDIPGELGLPLELVSTVQSGALAGLACVDRLRQILDSGEVSHRDGELRPQVHELQPSPSAQWLLHAASRLLPPASRDRYREEFASELRALTDAQAGSRAQLGHAVRQVVAVWALRRALATAAPRATDPDRAPAPISNGHDVGVRPRLRDQLREPLDRWLARRQARMILREQARTQFAESHASWPFPCRASGRHRR
jgi:hypothetical protein